MKRRDLLKWMAGAPVFGTLLATIPEAAWTKVVNATHTLRRVRPNQAGWPSADAWADLNKRVSGRLMKLSDPLAACRAAPSGKEAADFFAAIRNPYYILDNANLTQTSGWVNAWTSQPSAYAVAAQSASDVAEAVTFAREHRVRLVVKGAGHSFQGTSDAPDSLLVWTRHMDDITMHDTFVPAGCAGKVQAQPAVSVGAGQIWGQTYNAVTTTGGRYVQGGGCMTVGVAGLVCSGGFGSFSKHYGLAAAALLEAEVVTADGRIRTINACNDPDLFWALKGGGGGSFAVVTRLTLRTRELPEFFGGAFMTIQAASDAAFRRLIARFVDLYHDNLFNPHWGEMVEISSDNVLNVQMVFQGLDKAQAQAAWQPLIDFVRASPNDFVFKQEPFVACLPARHFWDPEALKKLPGLVVTDNRPSASADNIFFTGDASMSGEFIHGHGSAWLPATLLRADRRQRLVAALFASSRHWSMTLHFNKGLAGSPWEEIEAARDTAVNPQLLDAFALAMTGASEPPAMPGVPGHEPDVTAARNGRLGCSKAMQELYRIVPGAGSYVSESDYFLKDWQRAFWGSNHARLAAVKQRYDPDGLFTVHHGVGAEAWSDDGFTRIA